MRKFIKVVAGVIGVLVLRFVILTLACWIADTHFTDVNDSDLKPKPRESYVGTNAFEYLHPLPSTLHGAFDYATIENLLTDDSWDEESVEQVIRKNDIASALIDGALECDYLRFPEKADGGLSHATALRNAARLMKLRSVWHYRTGNHEQAVEVAFETVRFGVLIGTSNGGIIASFLGPAKRALGCSKWNNCCRYCTSRQINWWNTHGVALPSSKPSRYLSLD